MSSRARSIRLPAPFRDLPIFWKLLLPFLVLLMAVGSVGAFVIVRDLTSKSTAALSDQLTVRAVEARSVVHNRELDLIESANYATNQQGMAEALAAGRTSSVAALLRSVLALKTDLAVAVATNVRGISVAELVRSGRDASYGSATDWSIYAPVRDAIDQRGGTKTSGVIRLGDRMLMVMVAPVCRQAPPCARVGFAVVGLDVARVVQQLATATKGTVREAEDIALYDEDGRTLASTTKAPSPVRLSSATQIEQRRSEMDGHPVATAYTGFTLGGRPAGTIAVTIPAKTAFGSVGSAALRLVGLLVMAMAAAALLGAGVSRLIMRQLTALVDTSRELGEGKLSARAPVLSEDEHGELAIALNRMADQLEASHETLELQVEQRTEEIRRLLSDRTEFFAGLSHELRTPLAIILTQAEMLQTTGDRRAQGEATETIRASASQLLDVVNDILELARAEAGSVDVSLGRVRVQELIAELTPMLVRLGSASGVEVRVSLPARLPAVSGDRARLREVVVNLVDNAIKYTPSSGTIEIRAEEEAEEVRVSVADTGVGIPPQVGDHVFEPFYRVTGTSPQHEQASTGLGLALTRRWVEAQGGTIGWAPNPDGGTVFAFTLPIFRSRAKKNSPGRTASGNGRSMGPATTNGSAHARRRSRSGRR